MKRKTIYFICPKNSTRTQMAEGFAKKYLEINEWNVRSGGTEQTDLNQMAVKVMAEEGVDIGNQTTDLIDLEMLEYSDIVITLCSGVSQRYLEVNDGIRKEHWSFEDPTLAQGTEEEQLEVFRRVRDAIASRIKEFAEVESQYFN